MNRVARIALLTVVGIAAFWSAGNLGATASAASKVCPPVTGVKWVAPYAPHPSGTAYDLIVSGTMTCNKAAGYVKKVVAHHVHTGQSFAGGPSGWTCKGSPSKSGLAYTGTCSPRSQGFNARDYFSWTVG